MRMCLPVSAFVKFRLICRFYLTCRLDITCLNVEFATQGFVGKVALCMLMVRRVFRSGSILNVSFCCPCQVDLFNYFLC